VKGSFHAIAGAELVFGGASFGPAKVDEFEFLGGEFEVEGEGIVDKAKGGFMAIIESTIYRFLEI